MEEGIRVFGIPVVVTLNDVLGIGVGVALMVAGLALIGISKLIGMIRKARRRRDEGEL